MERKRVENNGPVAVVTGASSGIGRAVAELLAERGWRLVLAARGEGALGEVCAGINESFGDERRALAVPTDVGRPEQVRQLIAQTLREYGKVEALINNAGYAPKLPIERTDQAIIERAYMVNAIGPAVAIQAVWSAMISQRRGRIVNVSTMGTADPFAGFFAYASSKASVNVMAKSCDNEGKEHGVRAFAVAPGAVETSLLRELFDETELPADQCLAPSDVAQVIAECAEGKRDEQGGRTIFVSREGGRVVESAV